MGKRSEAFFLKKQTLVGLVILLFGIATVSLLDGFSLIGKPFQGFGMAEYRHVSQVFYNKWTGLHRIEPMTQMIAVNGEPLRDAAQLRDTIRKLPIGTPVTYLLVHLNGNVFTRTVPTMIFSWGDFIRVYLPFYAVVLVHLLMALFIVYTTRNYRKVKVVLGFTFLVALAAALFCDIFYTYRFSVLGNLAYIAFGGAFLYIGVYMNRKHWKPELYQPLSQGVIWLYGIYMVLWGVCFYGVIWFPQHALAPYFNQFLPTINIIDPLGFTLLPFLTAYAFVKSHPTSQERKQARIILTGTILTCTPLMLLFYLPYFLQISQFVSTEWVVLPFNILPILIAWAMIRHRAFDVEILIRKVLIYYAFTALLVTSYLLFSFLVTYSIQTWFQLHEQWTLLLSAFLTFFTANHFYGRVQNGIDRIFYRQKIDLKHILEHFEVKASHTLNKETVGQLALESLERAFNPFGSAIYLQQGETLAVLVQQGEPNFSSMLQWPIQKEKQILGWLYLGQKKAESDYSTEDKKFLERFLAVLSTHFYTSLMSEELVKFSLEKAAIDNKYAFIGQLTANLSHDFKSPLNSCYALVNKLLLLDQLGKLSEPVWKQELKKLLRCFDKFYHYINLSLDREMLEKGKLALKKEYFDAKKACQEAIHLHINVQEILSIQLCEDPVWLKGDQMRFEQAVSNLLSNAFKHAKNQIVLSLKKEDEKMVLAVKDDGTGIPSEKQNSIFQPYAHADEHGTGLGLWICKNYVELMGGTIHFEQKQGETVFSIQMPCFREPVPHTEIEHFGVVTES